MHFILFGSINSFASPYRQFFTYQENQFERCVIDFNCFLCYNITIKYLVNKFCLTKGELCMDIGNKIKLLRQKIGVTQEQLGEKVGVSAQSISKWETGVSQT